MDTETKQNLSAIARSNDLGKWKRFNESYGYGPRGDKTRWEWQQECLNYLLNKTKDEFRTWQESWVGIDDGGTCEDPNYRLTSEDEMRDKFPQEKHDLFPSSLDFTDCSFNNLQVNKYEFLVPVNFRNSKFSGKASFYKSKFYSNIDFNNSTFEYDTQFSGSLINRESDFSESKFNGNTNFDTAEFIQRTSFHAVKFLKEVNFNAVIFSDFVGFSDTSFNYYVGFRNAIFRGYAGFTKVAFAERAEFSDATFFSYAGFQDATFGDYATFINTTFNAFTTYVEAKFHGDVSFAGVSFKQDVDFLQTTFFKQCRFDNKYDTDNKSWTKETTFATAANFENAVFKNVGHFERVRFTSQTPAFRGCQIDSTRLEFSDESYFPRSENSEDAVKNISFLKRLADEHGQTDQALIFNAMELRAKRLQTEPQPAAWSFKVVTWLYEKISDYGRSFTKPLKIFIYLFLVTFVGALIFSGKSAPIICTERMLQYDGDIKSGSPVSCLSYYQTTDEFKLSGYRAAFEYASYRSSGILDFSDNDKQTSAINMRVFDQKVEPSWVRVYGVFKAIASTALLFLAALGLRNKYRIK